MILCDTNIFIEFYKNNSQIIQELRQIGQNELAKKLMDWNHGMTWRVWKYMEDIDFHVFPWDSVFFHDSVFDGIGVMKIS